MDFADALHLASSHNASKFAMFDPQMRKITPSEAKLLVGLL